MNLDDFITSARHLGIPIISQYLLHRVIFHNEILSNMQLYIDILV